MNINKLVSLGKIRIKSFWKNVKENLNLNKWMNNTFKN